MTPPAPRPEPSTVLIAEAALATVVGHARRCHPREACGLLATDQSGVVAAAYPIVNVAASPVAFTLDPAGHYAAATDAELRGWEIGGVFHSHPEGHAVPSPTDTNEDYPTNWVHLIVGLAPRPAVRAWDGRWCELTLVAAEELAHPRPQTREEEG